MKRENLEREERRESILDAVVRLLESGTAEDLRLSQIAEEAGISRMTLYRYFSSKEELMQSVVEERELSKEELSLTDMRTRILEAAREVFLREGWGATMEAIAWQAKVGVASVYRQFGDKANLIQEFRESLRPQAALAALELSASEDIEEDLGIFAGQLMKQMTENRDLFSLLIREKISGETHQSLESELAFERPGKTLRRLCRYFHAQCEAGRIEKAPPEELAIAWIGMIAAFAWLVPTIQGKEFEEPERIGRWIARLFVQGVSTKNPPTKKDQKKSQTTRSKAEE